MVSIMGQWGKKLFASNWMYLRDWIISAKVKLKSFQNSILDFWWQPQGVEGGDEARMLAGYIIQSYGAGLAFLRIPSEVILEEYTLDYGKDVWESGWVCMHYRIAPVKLRWFQKHMDFRSASGGCEEDGDEAEMVTVRNIWYNGASTVHWGIFVVDVSGEYNLEYGTDSMPSRVRQQDIECACMTGLCWHRLSWSNFRSILPEILQV